MDKPHAGHEAGGLIREVKTALAANATAARQVAGGAGLARGAPRPMTWDEMADRTGLGRATISGMSSRDSADDPRLSSVCRFAWALGIPPAFLLMTKKDWRAVMTVVAELSQADAVAGAMDHLRKMSEANPAAGLPASTGLDVARKLFAAMEITEGEDEARHPTVLTAKQRRKQAIVGLVALAQALAADQDEKLFSILVAAGLGTLAVTDYEVG